MPLKYGLDSEPLCLLRRSPYYTRLVVLLFPELSSRLPLGWVASMSSSTHPTHHRHLLLRPCGSTGLLRTTSVIPRYLPKIRSLVVLGVSKSSCL